LLALAGLVVRAWSFRKVGTHPASSAGQAFSGSCASTGDFHPMLLFRAIFLFALLILSSPSFAARCGGDFNSFIASAEQDAQAAGVSASVADTALGGVQQDGAVLAFDRRQRYTFQKSFEQYVSTRVGAVRINGGRAMLQRHAALLSRI